MYREHEKSINYIYENDLITKGKLGEETTDRNTTRIQSSELTGSDSVRNRCSRAAAVCLLLQCVLLVTAVIVLCVTFTQERQQFISKIENLTNEREQLILKNIILTNEKDQLGNELQIHAGWTYYQFSLYYMSNETKNWTESRRYCMERGADFVKKTFGGSTVYIGLIDIDVEGRWKWTDGSPLTSSFWASGEPSGGTVENCVVTVDNDPRWPTLIGWFDVPCNYVYQWICEKRISQLTLQ